MEGVRIHPEGQSLLLLCGSDYCVVVWKCASVSVSVLASVCDDCTSLSNYVSQHAAPSLSAVRCFSGFCMRKLRAALLHAMWYLWLWQK